MFYCNADDGGKRIGICQTVALVPLCAMSIAVSVWDMLFYRRIESKFHMRLRAAATSEDRERLTTNLDSFILAFFIKLGFSVVYVYLAVSLHLHSSFIALAACLLVYSVCVSMALCLFTVGEAMLTNCLH